MLTVRRIYLYLVSAISLITVTWSVIGLVRLVLDEGIGQGQITGLASLLAVIIVGLPIFLFHWLIAQRLARSSVEERESPIRQFYLYGVMAVGATPVFANIYRLAEKAFVAVLGGSLPNDVYPYDLTLAEHLAAIIVWTVVWFYLWRLTPRKGEEYRTAVALINLGVRRLYLLGFSLGGLVMVAWGSTGLIQTLMQSFSGILWHTLVGGYSAQLLVGTGIWVGHWSILQRVFRHGQSAEERSVLRKIYLYLAVFIFLVMALSSGTLLLKRLLELLLGAPPAEQPLLAQLSDPVSFLVGGGLFWAYHWSVLKEDAAQALEVPRQVSVRRIYYYLVAAVGLLVLLSGVGGLLTTLIDLLTSPAAVGLEYYREQVALFVAMTVVGTPVWWLPWRSMQRQVIQPPQVRKLDSAGTKTVEIAEYGSLVRRIYLYFFVFIASLAIFGSVGWFVYHILTALLGADLPDDFITLVLNALVIGLLAAVTWLYHWWVIRRDGALETKEKTERLADVSVVVIDGNDGRVGREVIRHLERDLPGIQIKAVGVTGQARETMDGQPFSTTALNTAQYVVGTWQILSNGGVASAVAGSSATKFVVPVVEPNWFLAGVKQHSLDYYGQQVAAGIKKSIEGEEVKFGQEMDVGTVLAIVIGGVLFLCLAGSMLSFAGSIF